MAEPSDHRAIWDANAPSWDAAMGSTGNSFYQHLVCPTALTLLSPVQQDSMILELACGNGIFSRRLRDCGACVIATDFSSQMIELTHRHGSNHDVEFSTLDYTSEKELNAFSETWGVGSFDAVVINMALMDIPTLEPLANALPRLLTDSGRFVATVMHPAFNSSGTNRGVQVIDDPASGRVRNIYSINVERYLDIPPTRGEAILGQAEIQYYFHRPLSELLRPFLVKGFVLDGFEEPAFKSCPDGKELSWENYSQIPPVMGFGLKKGRGLL